MSEKRDRLDEMLAARDLASVWFARPSSFTWLTGGSNVVNREAKVGVAAVGYDGDGLTVVTSNVEARRLREDELPADAAVASFEWHGSGLADAVAEHAATPAAADFDVPGFESVDASPLRQPLTDADVERYRALGEATADGVEEVCRDIQPTDAERDVAAAVTGALAERDVAAPVVLVGGAKRAQRHRHFTPTDAELGEYAIVSVVGVRGGLHASCSRTVAFDAPEWLGERHAGATTVEATALAATQSAAGSDGRAGSVFDAIAAAYEHVGRPDEWQKHHQGGAAGYAGREWFVAPDAEAGVTVPMAYAYNPTIQGAKSEDTVLVTGDGFETLTGTGDWPTTAVDAHGYDDALERTAILDR